MEQQARPTRQTLDKLPSLPQVLLRILEAISHDQADLQHLARIIRQDSAIAARLIAIANSSYYNRHHSCDSVDRALSTLGLETVKTLVITAAVKQYFSHFNQQHHAFMQRFWLRSLVSANTAQVLASLTSYRSPSEAYLSGLLMDVGQLWLLTEDAEAYHTVLQQSAGDDQLLLRAEREALGMTHCEAGFVLLDSWKLDNFMAIAVRFQHESAEDIRQSHHLVKIINLASELSARAEPGESAFTKAAELFGLNEELLLEMRVRIDEDVQRLAQNMGIHIAPADEAEDGLLAHRQLGEKIGDITQLQALQQSLSSAADPEQLQHDIRRNLHVCFGIDRYLIFLHDPHRDALDARVSADSSQADFSIDSSSSDCLVNRCFAQQLALSNEDNPPLSVTDRQLLSWCRSPYLLCMPFVTASQRGVLVAGASSAMLKQQREKSAYWQSLLNTIARLFDASGSGGQAGSPATQQRIEEAVHEASNPLSIIYNYLEMLRLKLGDSQETASDFNILKEEIDRIGAILLRLRQPDQQPELERVDVNQTIRDIARIFEQSMCLTRGIAVELELDNQLQPVEMKKAALRQILTNLLKNAVEAMPQGGVLRISTRLPSNGQDRNCLTLVIEDTGPGIPDPIRQTLFTPVVSTKGPEHSGIGLSVVKKLVDEMGGRISCDSSSDGTRFRLLFPMNQSL